MSTLFERIISVLLWKILLRNSANFPKGDLRNGLRNRRTGLLDMPESRDGNLYFADIRRCYGLHRPYTCRKIPDNLADIKGR